MAATRRAHLFWDPATDGAFRRRLERALGGLKVDTADGDTIDTDPDNPAVVIALASAAGSWAMPVKPDIVVQAGPGQFPDHPGAFRLEASDIDEETTRWTRFTGRLSEKLGMASLALAPEDLAARLDEAARRAEEAERALATAQLNEGNAIRERDQMRLQLSMARGVADALKAENASLQQANETGAFALGLVPAHLRDVVRQAREHAWRAQAVAAQAADMAGQYPGAIAWGAAASYAGEHRNGRPHGFGVMTFGKAAEPVAWYRGQFADGRRHGHGVGLSEDGLTWSGEWRNDAACGLGVLEAPDGGRYEGRVKPADDGVAKDGDGHTWPRPAAAPRKTHHAVSPLLPAPQDAR